MDLGNYKIKIEDETLEIAKLSNGDVRTALNTLELAVLTTEMNKDGTIKITKEIAAECMGKKKKQCLIKMEIVIMII